MTCHPRHAHAPLPGSGRRARALPRGHSPSPARHGQQPPVGRSAPPTNQPTSEMLTSFRAREGPKLRIGVALVQSNSITATVKNEIAAWQRGSKLEFFCERERRSPGGRTRRICHALDRVKHWPVPPVQTSGSELSVSDVADMCAPAD